MADMTGIKLEMSLEGLEDDLKRLEKNFEFDINDALSKEVKAQMERTLVQHIKVDVYDKYSPGTYARREDSGGLSDMGKNADFSYGMGVIELNYEPDGGIDHLPKVDEYGREILYPAPVHGDALISRIEDKKPEYSWAGTQSIPPRPFFRNFTADMIEGGLAEQALIRGLKRADPEYDIKPGLDAVREDEDWD